MCVCDVCMMCAIRVMQALTLRYIGPKRMNGGGRGDIALHATNYTPIKPYHKSRLGTIKSGSRPTKGVIFGHIVLRGRQIFSSWLK